MKSRSLLALSLLLCASAFAVEPAPAMAAEVAHLLHHLANSGCEFNRNGKWYNAADARDHLQRKYDYLRKKKWIATTEEFIHRGATASSTSKLPYSVRCGDRLQSSAAWLTAELQRLRAADPVPE